MRCAHRPDDERGFTLIELMVVVLVIAVLLTIAIPTFLGARGRAQVIAARSTLAQALDIATVTLAESSAIGSEPLANTVLRLQAQETTYTFTAGASTGPRIVSVATAAGDITLAVADADGTCHIGSSRTSGRLTADATGSCLASTFLSSALLNSSSTAVPPVTTSPVTTSPVTTSPVTTTAATPLTTVRLRTSTGAPLAGGAVSYVLGGYVHSFGTTDSNGSATASLAPGAVTLTIAYAGGQASTVANVGPGTVITFTTVPVTVQLVSSNGSGIAGAVINYFNPYWNVFGTTNASGTITKELLTGTYSTLQLDYAGGSNTRTNLTITAATTVTFTTVPVTIEFRTSSGSPIAGADVNYFNPYWNVFGTTNSSGTITKELLTGTYSKLDLSYAGGTSTRTNVSVTAASVISFATAPITVQLLSSNGSGIAGAVINYFNPYWNVFGTTDPSGAVTKELLPGTYATFQIDYAGGTNTRTNLTFTAATTITFTTVPVTMALLTSTGAGIAGADINYSNPYWNLFGTTNGSGIVVKELLPGSYAHFQLDYAGGVATRTNLTFTTATTVTFTTVPVTITVINASGSSVGGATISYANPYWNTFGTTASSGTAVKELLPDTYDTITASWSSGTAQLANVAVTAATSLTLSP